MMRLKVIDFVVPQRAGYGGNQQYGY